MNPSTLLPVPFEIDSSESAQILVVWLKFNEPTIMFKADVWEDPAAWGILLADIAKLVAHQYNESSKGSIDEILSRIVAGFRVELQSDHSERH